MISAVRFSTPSPGCTVGTNHEEVLALSLRKRLRRLLPVNLLTAVTRACYTFDDVRRRVTRSRAAGAERGSRGPFSAIETREQHTEAVTKVLGGAGVDYLLLPAGSGTRRRVVVAATARSRVVEALRSSADPGGDRLLADWWVEPTQRGHTTPGTPVPAAALGPQQRARLLTVFGYVTSPSGVVLGGPELGVEIEFWEQVETDDTVRVDGSTFERGTMLAPSVNRVAPYVSPGRWAQAQQTCSHQLSTEPLSHVFDVHEPIDLVYTWVDGRDPAWLERQRAALAGITRDDHNPTALAESRFFTRDELRYSLRSVEMYADWYHHIYLVTDGQTPSWLRTDHPRLTVVDHREIFADPAALPVFNSHAIESQLHHIPGLTRRYVYLNDDVFFGRPTTPELFFHANGLSKFFLSSALLDVDAPSSRDLPVLSAAKHNRELIEERFGVTVTNKMKHTPHPQQREVLEDLEAQYPEMFDRVMRSKFRHPDDVSIASNLHHYYAYCRGLAVPGDLRYVYQDLTASDTAFRLERLLGRKECDTFCLNDTLSTPEQMQQQLDLMGRFWLRYFPVPSSFERSGPVGATR